MSKYCGKCDVYDTFVMIGERDDDYLKRSKFYIRDESGKEHRVHIQNQTDLIPYYPYLVSSMGSDSESAVCFLSKESFVDTEERTLLQGDLDRVLRYYNKCKRNKIKFDEKEAYKCIVFFEDERPYAKEIVERVKRDGKKASINGIHLNLWEYYRRELYDDMIKAGYNEYQAYKWCFSGWEYDDALMIRNKS